MSDDHGVRVDNEYLGLNSYCGVSVEWYLQINHKTAVNLATAISKAIDDAAVVSAKAAARSVDKLHAGRLQAARAKALDEVIGLYVAGGNPDVWLHELQQLKERDDDG